MSKKALPAHDIGSGNIFADLGLPNAEEHQLKAALVVQLGRLIKQRKLSQIGAAKLLGIKQPDLSKILRPGIFGGAADADADGIRPGCRNHHSASQQNG
jgi:predicted XRE-type DNA-binding protein